MGYRWLTADGETSPLGGATMFVVTFPVSMKDALRIFD
jgi:hypothetical protein